MPTSLLDGAAVPASAALAGSPLALAPATRQRFFVAAAVTIATLLPVQATLTPAGTPLRLSLGDVAVAALLPMLLAMAWREGRAAIDAHRPAWMALLIPGTAVITYGFIVGFIAMGDVQGWALLKYAGWYVLLGVAASGALLALVSTSAARLATAALIGGLCLPVAAYMGLSTLGEPWPFPKDARLSGLAGNPNAFGVAAVCGLAALLGWFPISRRHERPGWPELAAGMLCAGALFSRSMAAAVGIAVVMILFVALRRNCAAIVRVLLLAAAFFAAPAVANTVLHALAPETVRQNKAHRINDKIADAVVPSAQPRGEDSIGIRREEAAQALELWRLHPVLGAGLGSYLDRQATRSDGRPVLIIHSTPLWLLTEFGLLGLCLFAALAGSLARFFYHRLARGPAAGAPVGPAACGLMLLAAWVAMSFAHELLYQRIPWFVLGLSVGVLLKHRRDATTG